MALQEVENNGFSLVNHDVPEVVFVSLASRRDQMVSSGLGQESSLETRAKPGPISLAARNMAREIRTTWIMAGSKGAFARLRGESGLKVHLGCGRDVRDGWVNLDLIMRPSIAAKVASSHPKAIFINHDLRRGLPLSEGSCARIYSSHFFEHLELRDGVDLMRDCYAALAPGGTIRFVLPDFRRAFSAYLQADTGYFDLVQSGVNYYSDVVPGAATICDAVNYTVYQFGEHHCVYDTEKLTKILRAIGFTRAEETPYDHDIDPADPAREKYSFCVEATK